MTAHDFDGARQRCPRAGMDDYICKPVDLATLGKIMSRWLLAGHGHERSTAFGRAGGAATLDPIGGPESGPGDAGGGNEELLDAIC